MEYVTPKVVAEIGAVHLGKIDRAKELIKLAKFANADYVKFQKRNPIESVPKEKQNLPHPNQIFSYGNTYLEHRLNLELSIESHVELKSYCDNLGIGYATSVWDLTSAKEIVDHINPEYIKIPSACNNHVQLINYLFDIYQGGVHVSTGMTTESELTYLFDLIKSKSVGNRVVIYHCTSEYPCEFENLYLQEIPALQKKFGDLGVRIGFSGHHKGIAVDQAAYTLGAEWFERHFVDDRTIRHTDASASLEPEGMRKLCRDLKATKKSLQSKRGMSADELSQREKLKFRVTD